MTGTAQLALERDGIDDLDILRVPVRGEIVAPVRPFCSQIGMGKAPPQDGRLAAHTPPSMRRQGQQKGRLVLGEKRVRSAQNLSTNSQLVPSL